MQKPNTIVALASARGAAGIAVIRASGANAHTGAKALLKAKIPPARLATVCSLYDPETGVMLDQALVITFHAPNSFTGENSVEYQIHGGRAVIDAVLAALLKLPDHRLAEPGEFTRRAFENGRMDLTSAEAVADLVHAETESQRVQALNQLNGSLASIYTTWADTLKKVLAYTEADLDFTDEQDVPNGLAATVKPKLETLISEISAHLDDNRRGEILRDGVKIAVVGAPNAGKSTLVNALALRDVAIVSPIAGTTRDVVEVHLNLGGYAVILADTAGLRPEQLGQTGQDQIESEGIKRALNWAENADILLLAFDGGEYPILSAHTKNLMGDKALALITKSELLPKNTILPPEFLPLSVQENSGLDILLAALTTRIQNVLAAGNGPSLTRTRHRDALQTCVTHLRHSLTVTDIELAAEDLRQALRALGSITGHVHVEHLLDVIFRDFCIGK